MQHLLTTMRTDREARGQLVAWVRPRRGWELCAGPVGLAGMLRLQLCPSAHRWGWIMRWQREEATPQGRDGRWLLSLIFVPASLSYPSSSPPCVGSDEVGSRCSCISTASARMTAAQLPSTWPRESMPSACHRDMRSASCTVCSWLYFWQTA